MKLQSMTVLYVLIILPLLLVLTFTLTHYTNVMRTRIDYRKKLIGATQDGIKAFELNTSQEEFSSVSDALKSIVEASINTFKDSFALKLGIANTSRSNINEYIPFTMFTLNDGYYIESPSFVPHVARYSSGQAVTVDSKGIKSNFNEDSDIEYYGALGTNKKNEPDKGILPSNRKNVLFQYYDNKIDESVLKNPKEDKDIFKGTINPLKENLYYDRTNVVKNFIPYSAKYKKDKTELVISYSMDNFLNITGKIDDEHFVSRSGYLLDYETVKNFKIEGIKVLETNGTEKGIEAALKYFSNGTIKITFPYYREIRKISVVDTDEEQIEENIENAVISYTADMNNLNYDVQTGDMQYKLQQRDAVMHYIKAYYFSKWVYEELNKLEFGDVHFDIPKDILDKVNSTMPNALENVNETIKNKKIFEQAGYNVSSTESDYNLNKKLVMKNSIQYNLLIAGFNYSNMKLNAQQGNTLLKSNPKLPIIKEEDWESILTNVSILAFCQGLKLGFSEYNDYVVVSSTHNDFLINENNLYFVQNTEKFNIGESDKNNKNKLILEADPGEFENQFHKISCKKLKQVLAVNKNATFIGDTVNSFIYDGKELTIAEQKKAGGQKMKFKRRNFLDTECIVEKVEKEKLNQEQISILASSIGALKNRAYHITTIDFGSNYYIKTNDTNINLPQGRTLKSVELVIQKPKIDPQKNALQAFVTTGNFKYKIEIEGNSNKIEETISINADYKDSNSKYIYEKIKIDNLNQNFKKDATLKDNVVKNLNYDSSYNYFMPGNQFRITLKNIKKDLIISEDAKILEIRVNYE